MIGEREEDNRCYFCGGSLVPDFATIPFVVGKSVIVIKEVPALVCTQCGEAIMDSAVAEVVDQMLKRAWQSGFEVSVITYNQSEPVLT